MGSKTNRSITVRLFLIQSVLLLSVSLAWLFAGKWQAYSALLGGLCCLFPSLLFAYLFFGRAQYKTPAQILKSFYLGEFIKLMISVSLLFVVLLKLEVEIVALFTGYIVTYFGIWSVPFLATRYVKRAQDI